MAKQTKRETRAEPAKEDFHRAREILLQRANAIILQLAKRYELGKAEELTTVLDAMDSLAELERLHGPTSAGTMAVGR